MGHPTGNSVREAPRRAPDWLCRLLGGLGLCPPRAWPGAGGSHLASQPRGSPLGCPVPPNAASMPQSAGRTLRIPLPLYRRTPPPPLTPPPPRFIFKEIITTAISDCFASAEFQERSSVKDSHAGMAPPSLLGGGGRQLGRKAAHPARAWGSPWGLCTLGP